MAGIYDVEKLASQVSAMAEQVRLTALTARRRGSTTAAEETELTANGTGLGTLQTALAAAIVDFNAAL